MRYLYSEELWMEGFCIGYIISFLKTRINYVGEDSVRKEYPDIPDEVFSSLRGIRTDCSQEESDLFWEKHGDALKGGSVYKEARSAAERRLKEKRVGEWREKTAGRFADFLENSPGHIGHSDLCVPVAVCNGFEGGRLVPPEVGLKCFQETKDRIRMGHFILEQRDLQVLSGDELKDFLRSKIGKETMAVCRYGYRAVVIQGNSWTQWQVDYVSPEKPWYFDRSWNSERIKEAELDGYGRITDWDRN